MRLYGFPPIKILRLISAICHDFLLMLKFNLHFERLCRFMYDAGGALHAPQQPPQLWPPSTSTHNLNFPGYFQLVDAQRSSYGIGLHLAKMAGTLAGPGQRLSWVLCSYENI